MSKSKKKRSQGSADISSVVVHAVIGSAVSAAVFFALAAIFAFLCWKTDAEPSKLKLAVLAAGLAAGFFGGFAAVRPIKKYGLPLGAASALPAYAIIILIATIVGRTGIGSVGWIFLAVITAASAVGGIISANKQNHRLH